MNEEASDFGLGRLRQGLRQDIGEYVDAAEARIRQHVEAIAADTRRHFDVVAEGLLSNIQLLAEGLSTLDQKVDRFRDEVRDRFRKVDRRFLRLEARMAALEHH